MLFLSSIASKKSIARSWRLRAWMALRSVRCYFHRGWWRVDASDELDDRHRKLHSFLNDYDSLVDRRLVNLSSRLRRDCAHGEEEVGRGGISRAAESRKLLTLKI